MATFPHDPTPEEPHPDAVAALSALERELDEQRRRHREGVGPFSIAKALMKTPVIQPQMPGARAIVARLWQTMQQYTSNSADAKRELVVTALVNRALGEPYSSDHPPESSTRKQLTNR